MKVRIKALPQAQSGLEVKINPGLGQNHKAMPWPGKFGKMSEPELNISETLKPVPREVANLEAEKGEIVMTPGQGGIPETYKVGGERHFKGGTPLKLPAESFVFSDTKDMRIKDPEIIKQFGMQESKSGYTPAEIAGKYNVNKFQKLLRDPNSDDLQRKTAEGMISNYNLKLAKLALIQESMKGFPTGIPMVAMPYVEQMNIDPKEFIAQEPGQEQSFNPDMGEAQFGANVMSRLMTRQNGGNTHVPWSNIGFNKETAIDALEWPQKSMTQILGTVSNFIADPLNPTIAPYQAPGDYVAAGLPIPEWMRKGMNLAVDPTLLIPGSAYIKGAKAIGTGAKEVVKAVPKIAAKTMEKVIVPAYNYAKEVIPKIYPNIIKPTAIATSKIAPRTLPTVMRTVMNENPLPIVTQENTFMDIPKYTLDTLQTKHPLDYQRLMDMQARGDTLINIKAFGGDLEMAQKGKHITYPGVTTKKQVPVNNTNLDFNYVDPSAYFGFMNQQQPQVSEFSGPGTPGWTEANTIKETPIGTGTQRVKVTANPQSGFVEPYGTDPEFKDFFRSNLVDEASALYEKQVGPQGETNLGYGTDITYEDWSKSNPGFIEHMKKKGVEFNPKDKEHLLEYEQWYNNDVKKKTYNRALNTINAKTKKNFTKAEAEAMANKAVMQVGFTGDDSIRGMDQKWGHYHRSRKELNFKELAQEKAKEEVIAKAEEYKGDKTTPRYANTGNAPWWLQDIIKTAGAAGDFMRVKKYAPWQANPNFVLPEMTFYDPTRELAASAEQTNIGSQQMANMMGPQSYASNFMGLQGQGFKNAADIMGRYNNLNVGASNQQNAAQTAIMNQASATKAGLATQLYDKYTAMNQQFDNAKNMARQNLRQSYINAITNKANAQAMNTIYEDFQIDPSSGGYLAENPNHRALTPDDPQNTDAFAKKVKGYMDTYGWDVNQAAAVAGKEYGVNPTTHDKNAQGKAFLQGQPQFNVDPYGMYS